MEAHWLKGHRPNYQVNVDLMYPYSELPYLGEYHLVKIPTHDRYIDHVDYWGEGRISISDGNSGFPKCYNVNRQYQVVSNGSDRDSKIPNRIPVFDENTCDSSSYIKNHSVKLVTLMGAPIIESCARDIARMVSPDIGSVVVFGFDTNSKDLQRLQSALMEVSVFYCPEYKLPKYFADLTLFDRHIAFLNATEMEEELYISVTGWSFDRAVEISRTLDKSGGGSVLTSSINRLLEHGITNTTSYAYRLWETGEKDIVMKYFPEAFKLLFNGDNIKIESNYYNMDLKLDANVDYYKDRLGWGDKSDHSSHRVSWKMYPIWDGNRVVFKINNNEHNMFLKLDVNIDKIGDRKCWGSNSSNEQRHTWAMDPVKFEDKVLFFIVNREYDQALKLDAHTDSYGDRLLWGNNGGVISNPRYFGWLIKPW